MSDIDTIEQRPCALVSGAGRTGGDRKCRRRRERLKNPVGLAYGIE
jgi:hypothetical protein